jgi:isopenicillin-N epimerase
MVPLQLESLGAAYYTGNCHKWLCAPKGAAILYVRKDRQAQVRPLAISHGANSPRRDRSRFQLEFDWTGTSDPTPFVCVKTAIEHLPTLVEGGWPEIRARNRALALKAQKILSAALGVPAPAPEDLIGALAAVPLPGWRTDAEAPQPPLYFDRLQDALLFEHHIEVPIGTWPHPPERLLRISAQLYNSEAEYEYLACALKQVLR